VTALADALRSGRLSDRVWLYSNYHCNLRCTYCLTESAPAVPRRELGRERMVALAREARELGFGALGVTGGEPFLLEYMPALVGRLADELPTLVLSNGTVFNARRLHEIEALAGKPVALQISLDRPDPEPNDVMRGPENFARVVAAVPELVRRGIRVRIATTLEDPDAADPDEMARLCELHRALGVPDEDHVVRPIVRRGRAQVNALGVAAGVAELDPELTITADGAFLHPFAPTVEHGRTDLDLLISRQTAPLHVAAERFLRVAAGLPAGADVVRNIR
jgi:MoaA/NifB/PqqE/SkfB family radical SAM enzyme